MSSSSQPSWHLTETYKGLVTLAVEALKILALVNGGAAVAVLTYLGNLVSRSGAVAAPPNIRPALIWYCTGIFATTVAFVVGYVTQLVLYNEEVRVQDNTRGPQYHIWGVLVGIVLALFSAAAFFIGCLEASHALTTAFH